MFTKIYFEFRSKKYRIKSEVSFLTLLNNNNIKN